jgi:uncharacterized protein (TIGR03435 family)
MRLERGSVSITLVAIGAAAIAFAQAGPAFQVALAGEGGAAPGQSGARRPSRTPQRIAFRAARVGDIMAFAYGLPLDRIERRPQWMYDDLYNVAVTTVGATGLPEQKLMLQKLLEERFGLAVHRVSNESPVYFLVPAGAKVYFTESKEADAGDIRPFCISHSELPPQPGRSACTATHVSISELADWLYLQVRLPVIDKTGLTGFYDLEITGLPIRGGAEGTIRAVRNSLGLNLESHRGTAESLIIDHAERPSGN